MTDVAEHTYKVAFGPAMAEKLPPGDPRWPTFNAAFENLDLRQDQIAAKLYAGHPITTQHANHWRHSKNYLLGQHLGLDFDSCDKGATIAQIIKDPFIHKYAAIVHSTISHTPDSPRSRVIFLLDTPIHQAKNYCQAAAALLWVFSSADRQCKDAARFFYGGRPGACEMEWLGNELPLLLVKDLIKRYQETGARALRQAQRHYEPNSADEREVMGALRHIDAWDIAYDEWVSLLMAIHAEFPGDNGLAIAEAWAQGRDGEVAQKWRSFNAAGNVSGRVGIGTLFAMAKDRGWERSHSA